MTERRRAGILGLLPWLAALAGCGPVATAERALELDPGRSVPPGYLISAPVVPTHPDKVHGAGLGLDEAEGRARIGDLARATEALDRALDETPDDRRARLLRGVASWERASLAVPMDTRERHAQLERAQRDFEAVIAQDDGDRDAWWGLLRTWHSPARAFGHGEARDLRRTLQASERVLELDPDNWVAGLDRGILLFELGRLDEARAQLDGVTADLRLDAYPGLRAQAWEHLGRAQLARGDLDAAEASLRTALDSWTELGGSVPYYRGCPLMSLGEIMLATGQEAEAQQLYTQAARLDAQDPQQALGKAVTNLQADAYARAADVLTLLARADLAAVGTPPKQAEEIQGQARALLVLVALAQRDEAGAEAQLARAPQGPLADLAAGHLALQRGELDQAKQRLEAALTALAPGGALSPPSDPGWYGQRMALLGLGWLAGLEGQHTAALAFHLRVSAHNPGDPLAAAGQARALMELGRTDQARALVERALGRHPEHPLLLNTLGVLLVDDGALTDARRSFEAAREQGGSGYTCPLEGLGMVSMLAEADQTDPTLAAKQRELAGLLAQRQQAEPVDRPNFLVIDIDSLRDDRVEDAALRPPVIGSLAARGVIFEDTTSPSGWTLPALASLLTGRLPPLVETARQQVRWIPDDPAPLPLILHHYGYDTAAFWGETAPVIFQRFCPGFDIDQKANGPQGLDRYHAQVVRWIEGRAREPFFALVHNIDLTNEPTEVSREALLEHGIPNPPQLRLGMERLQEAAAQRLDPEATRALCVQTYDERLRSYDQAIGAILAALEARGLRERTVVILTSNHGQDLFEHGLVGHGSILYQSVLQVPLLVVDPGQEGRAGTRIQAPVQLMDLAPWMLERAGIPVAVTMDGRSFGPLLEDPSAPWPELPMVSVANRYGMALRQGDSKILRHTVDPLHNGYTPDPGQDPVWPPPTVTELFDLASDPRELHDLSTERPALLATMEAELDRWAAILEARTSGAGIEDDPALREALAERGYWMHAKGEE